MAIQAVTADDVDPKVLRSPGPAVLDFYQASCPPCRVLEPRLEHVAEQYAGRVPVYRVDIDRDMAVAERFKVMSIPTLVILWNGREVERLDGLITEADLRAAFERAARPPGSGGHPL